MTQAEFECAIVAIRHQLEPKETVDIKLVMVGGIELEAVVAADHSGEGDVMETLTFCEYGGGISVSAPAYMSLAHVMFIRLDPSR